MAADTAQVAPGRRRHRYVFAYDVADDRRRTRVAEMLGSFGRRVGLSVFEAEMTPRELGRLRAGLAGVVDADGDRVLIYRLCGPCARRGEVLGRRLGAVVGDVVRT